MNEGESLSTRFSIPLITDTSDANTSYQFPYHVHAKGKLIHHTRVMP
jgi:hypothetical protein